MQVTLVARYVRSLPRYNSCNLHFPGYLHVWKVAQLPYYFFISDLMSLVAGEAVKLELEYSLFRNLNATGCSVIEKLLMEDAEQL